MQYLSQGHRIQLLKGGSAYFSALIAAIGLAKNEIRLETYIFHADPTGELVMAALVAAAQRGVSVYLVMDGIGTPLLQPQWVEQLEQSGVHWTRYLPLGALGWLLPGRWRRLHRKLCVIDRQVGFCGGINILDDLFALGHGWQSHARLDFAVQVTGPLVSEMWSVMLQFWQRLQLTQALEQGKLRTARSQLQSWQTWQPDQPSQLSEFSGLPARRKSDGLVSAALLLRDNVQHRTDIERSYRHAIAHAREEILIANAYFIPGAKLRRALLHAAKRGVKVALLLPGRYEFFLQFHAGKPLYAELLAAGVEIYEYRYSHLHAKVAVIDRRWVTIGSSNLDPFSMLLAREANVVVSDAALAVELRGHLWDAIQAGSERLEPHCLAHRQWRERAQDWLAYAVMRITLLLTGKHY